MRTIGPNEQIVISVPVIDEDGNPVTPTALAWVLRDENDEIIRPSEDIEIVEDQTDYDITVPASSNIELGPRSVELRITHAGGVSISSVVYGVIERARLIYATNSFQTLSQAIFLARDIPNIDSFLAASRNEQEKGLIEAFYRLTRLNFVIPPNEYTDTQSRILMECAGRLTPRMWAEITPELLNEYPARFLLALRKAQIAEANEIASGDPIAAKRRAGLLSESIGESSMMFRTGVRPLELGTSRVALSYLTGYLNNRLTIGRA